MALFGQTQDLNLYIPFIDLAVSLDKEKFVKLVLIKEWILENQKFPVEVLEKLKQSIRVQYKKLVVEYNVKIPENIVEIFNMDETTKVEVIDLCSDDERSAKRKDSSRPSSSKVEKNKPNKVKITKNEINLSDGEIIDSDSEIISTASKKPASFHIKTGEKITNDKANISKTKTNDKANVSKTNPAKTMETVTANVSTKITPEKLKKIENEIYVRRETEKLPPKEKSTIYSANSVQPDKDEETESFLKRIDIICGKVDSKTNDSVECMTISDNSIDESTFELSTNVRQLAEALAEENSCTESKGDEQIFTRRSYQIETNPNRRDLTSKSKVKKSRKKRICSRDNFNSGLLPDLSSDEDTAVAKPTLLKKTVEKDVTIISLSDTDDLNEESAERHNADIQNKNLSSSSASEKLEKMDINELSSVFKKLTKSNSIDFEGFLNEVAQTEEYKCSSPATSPYYCDDNIKSNDAIETNVSMPAQVNASCVAKEKIFVRRTTSQTPTEIQQKVPFSITRQTPSSFISPTFPVMNQVPPPPPSMHPTTAPNCYPIIYINGRKINLNDPRVKNHLLSFQSPSAPKESKQMQSNDQLVQQSCNTNHCKTGPTRAMTYGEYKRRKAEEAEEIERRKQATIQAKLEIVNSEKAKDDGTSNPKSGLSNSNSKSESPQMVQRAETTHSKEPKKSKKEEIKNCVTDKQLIHESKAEKNKGISVPQSEKAEISLINTTQKQQTKSKTKNYQKLTTRVLKELECTVKGFDRLEDYLPQSLSGKRKCSENARSAIAKQLNGHQQYTENLELENKNNKRSRISMRRSSMGTSLEQINISQDSPAPIAKRRKTCTEVNLATLLQDSSSESTEDLTTPSQKVSLLKKVNRNESSSDTDTFDLDEFNYKKTKALALKNQPFVLLQRLTDIEINKHLRRSQRSHIPPEQMSLNVKLVEKTTREVTECDNPPLIVAAKNKSYKNFPNTDVHMTERNTTYCALCKAKPVNLVNHYIRTHKTEPYISRLSISELEDLQLNCPFAVLASSSKASTPKYKVQCLFCTEELMDSFINFYTHFSSHTGEYAFKCSNCELKKPYRADIISHKNNAKYCRNAHTQKLYVYPTNLMVIYLHCCKLCNFVQLNEANVYKHLRDQHAKRVDDAIYVQRYIAAAINDAEIVNEVFPEDDDFLAREASFVSNQENDADINCSEIDIKPDLSPYTCLPDINYPRSSTPSTVMPSTPMPNLLTTDTSSCPNKKSESKTENLNTEVELPRPIVVKIEVKTESNAVSNEEPSSNVQTYRNYPPNVCYYGVFKCMATDCFYSTDGEAEIVNHLNDHGSSKCPPTGWLECSYCKLKDKNYSSAVDLIGHIKLRHIHCQFQCPSCSYRSCVAGSVAIHCAKLHNTSTPIFVYNCKAKSVPEDERMRAIKNSMVTNVKKLQCTECEQSFYAISALRTHLCQNHETFDDELQLTREYSCIYCVKSVVKKRDMQEHIAFEHSDKLAYACRRVLKNTLLADSIDNLQLCNIEEIIPLTSIRTPPTPVDLVQESSSYSKLPHELKEKAMNSSETYCANQELSSLDSGTESVAPELLEEQSDLKPSPEQLIYIAEESLRALLNKLSLKTGLSPDRIYHCPVATCGGFFSTHALWSRHMTLKHNCLIARCPHCHKHREFALSDFSQHFEHHLRHLYVCFHCSETFVSEKIAIAHFITTHSNEENFRFELVKFNFMHSYRIIVSKSVSSDRLEFCQMMQNKVVERLKQRADEASSKLLSKWLVPASADWLDDYPTVNRNGVKSCIVKGCSFKTGNIEKHFQHWEANHDITGDFKCARCALKINNLCNWQPIIEHVRMHDSSYVCCVCNYFHFGRIQMSAHVSKEHNSRDVPFVSVFHSTESVYIGVGVVFAESCKTFSTTHACFFCKASNLTLETLSKHFRQEHNVSMQHYCEICGILFKNLSEVDVHYTSHHAGSKLKIRCEFVSDLQILVRSTFPLALEVVSSDIKAPTSKQSCVSKLSESIDKVEEITQPNNLITRVNKSAESGICVKKELPDDGGNGSDSDVEIIEEDDLVRAEEFKARRNEQSKQGPEVPLLRVKNLLESNKTTITPITTTTTSPPITDLPMSITVTPISFQSSKPSTSALATTTNASTSKQSPTVVTITSGSVQRPLLQQALYNNAAISTQQTNPPKNFLSSSNVVDPTHTQQIGANHQVQNLNRVISGTDTVHRSALQQALYNNASISTQYTNQSAPFLSSSNGFQPIHPQQAGANNQVKNSNPVTSVAGTDTLHRSSLQQAYNNASISTQHANQPNKFLSSLNGLQPVNPQQPVAYHHGQISNPVPKPELTSTFSYSVNQGSLPQQQQLLQNQQPTAPPQPMACYPHMSLEQQLQNHQSIPSSQPMSYNPHLSSISVTQQTSMNEIPYISQISSSQYHQQFQSYVQNTQLQQSVPNTQYRNLSPIFSQAPMKEFSLELNQASSQQHQSSLPNQSLMNQPNDYFAHQSQQMHTNNLSSISNQSSSDRQQPIQYSISSQQIRPDGQQKLPPYKNVTIIKKLPSPTFPQQTADNNQYQNFQKLQPIAQKPAQPYNNSHHTHMQLPPNLTKQITAQAITVRLSSHVNANKKIMSPAIPNPSSHPVHSQQVNSRHIGLPAAQLNPVGQNWSPTTSIDVATPNWNKTQQKNINMQIQQNQNVTQSFQNPAHNYYR